MKIKPILWAIVVSPGGFRGPSESQEQLESHPVIPPKPGYAKNRAEMLQKGRRCGQTADANVTLAQI